jgi:tRNA pseudouridine38-40 synthase
MARYQVILSYDGTQFRGFQRQVNARTVQGVLEVALKGLGWRGDSILASGRTDSGVHAHGQVVVFNLDWKHSPGDLRRALNHHLPDDVSVIAVMIVNRDFHPRFSALARHYRYRVFCDEVRQPLRERYAWRVWPKADLEPMQRSANYLIGVHDFSALGSPLQPGGSTHRRIFQANWSDDGRFFIFDIVGNAFLYHMVRRIVFLLMKIGQGKGEPEEVVHYLEGRTLTPLQGLAPPQGLALLEVIYPPRSVG